MAIFEAEQSALELSLQDQFQRLTPPDVEEKTYLAALRRFTTATGNPRWWWEYFRPELPQSSRIWKDGDKDGMAFRRIVEVVPDPDQKVWFIPEEDLLLHPVYLATPRVIQEVIGNSNGFFEYYLIDPTLNWLLCETHCGEMIAIGDPVASNLANVKE